MANEQIALLSQEGSGIAKRIPRGVVPKSPIFSVVPPEPPRRFAPPLLTQEGCFVSTCVSDHFGSTSFCISFHAAMTCASVVRRFPTVK
jgi:hypothetical protein